MTYTLRYREPTIITLVEGDAIFLVKEPHYRYGEMHYETQITTEEGCTVKIEQADPCTWEANYEIITLEGNRHT